MPKFCLENDLVGILQSPLSFPSEDDIKSKKWEFCPCGCPLTDPPPIPNNVFMHYFNSTFDHTRNIWLNRFPKKLNGSIRQAQNDLGRRQPDPVHGYSQIRGWGIQIVEGPNKKAMLWLTIIVVIASLFSASLWAVFTKNSQQVFGIVECLLGSHAVLMVAFYNHH